MIIVFGKEILMNVLLFLMLNLIIINNINNND